jgi:hypothetical protein
MFSTAATATYDMLACLPGWQRYNTSHNYGTRIVFELSICLPLLQAEPKLDQDLRRGAADAFVALRGCSYGRADFRVDATGQIGCPPVM